MSGEYQAGGQGMALHLRLMGQAPVGRGHGTKPPMLLAIHGL